MAVVVVNESQFGIAVFAAPLDGLDGASAGCDFAVRGVGVGCADVTGGVEYLTDVLRQIPAVAVPCPVFLDGKGTRGDGLCRIPCDEPQARLRRVGGVTCCNLQVVAVDVALVEGDFSILRYFFGRAAPDVVVGAGDLCFRAVFFRSGEGDGAVL